MIRTAIMTAFLLLGALGAPESFASGGGYINGSGAPGGLPRKEPDNVYEYGKSIYQGRAPGATKQKYCLIVDGEPKKLNRRTARAWRGSDRLAFANALYNCDEPANLALKAVDEQQVPYVLYYLNKRFKLELAAASAE